MRKLGLSALTMASFRDQCALAGWNLAPGYAANAPERAYFRTLRALG